MNINISSKCHLEERVNLFEQMLNHIPGFLFQLTISSSDELKFSYVNENILTYFAISEFELNDNVVAFLKSRIHPEDQDHFFTSLFNSKKNLIHWKSEFRVLTKSQNYTWFKVDANVTTDDANTTVFNCILSDISDVKLQEIKIKESETRYQFALQASKNGIWDYNLKTGEVFFSKESLDILFLDESDNINTNSKWDNRIHPDDMGSYAESIQLHKENKTPFFESTKRVLAKDNTYKWVLSMGKIIQRDLEGNPIRIIGTHSDVTHLKQKESELLVNLDIIVEQNNRLLNFAHIVSHNLRSHTGNFKMLLDVLNESEDEQSKDECLQYLKTTSNALSETIDHLKELVDIHNTIIHKKEDLNLNHYLKQTLDVLSPEIKDNKVKIVNKIGEKDTIKFNPAYLESLFLNFTTNAIKYSHPDREPQICYSSSIQNGKVILQIEDNGLGINLEKHGEKLFGMYKTFHKNNNARGIGLFITKNQIESMGGSIEVESKVNVGTTFKIKFDEKV